jgi:hypothetical protein
MTAITQNNKTRLFLVGAFSMIIIGGNAAWAPVPAQVDESVQKAIAQYQNPPAQVQSPPVENVTPVLTPQSSVNTHAPASILPPKKTAVVQPQPKPEVLHPQPTVQEPVAQTVTVQRVPHADETKPAVVAQEKVQAETDQAAVAEAGDGLSRLPVVDKLMILALVVLALVNYSLWRSSRKTSSVAEEQLAKAKKALEDVGHAATAPEKPAKSKSAAKASAARDEAGSEKAA